jgi:hypothetical protein
MTLPISKGKRRDYYDRYHQSDIFNLINPPTQPSHPAALKKEPPVTTKISTERKQFPQFQPDFSHIEMSARERLLLYNSSNLHNAKNHTHRPLTTTNPPIPEYPSKRKPKTPEKPAEPTNTKSYGRKHQLKEQPNRQIKPDATAKTRNLEMYKSNIFFNPAVPERYKTISTLPNKTVPNQPKREPITKAPKINRSEFSSHFDWTTKNTEIKTFTRCKTEALLTGRTSKNTANFHKTRYYNEDTQNCNLKEQYESLAPNQKAHFNNVESVSYNVINGITKTEPNEHCGRQKDNFITEHYALSFKDADGYSGTNVRKLKQLLANEGISMNQVKEKANVLNGTDGKLLFEIRRGKGEKMDEKVNKIKEFMKGKEFELEKYDPQMRFTATKPKQEPRIGEVKSKGDNKRT